jgi:hypothetical protein
MGTSRLIGELKNSQPSTCKAVPLPELGFELITSYV